MKKNNLSLVSYEEAVRNIVKKAQNFINGQKDLDFRFNGFYIGEEKIIESVSVVVVRKGFESRVLRTFSI